MGCNAIFNIVTNGMFSRYCAALLQDLPPAALTKCCMLHTQHWHLYWCKQCPECSLSLWPYCMTTELFYSSVLWQHAAFIEQTELHHNATGLCVPGRREAKEKRSGLVIVCHLSSVSFATVSPGFSFVIGSRCSMFVELTFGLEKGGEWMRLGGGASSEGWLSDWVHVVENASGDFQMPTNKTLEFASITYCRCTKHTFVYTLWNVLFSAKQQGFIKKCFVDNSNVWFFWLGY